MPAVSYFKWFYENYFSDNPALIRGLRTRMRGFGAYALIAGHLFLVSLAAIITVLVEDSFRGVVNGKNIGQHMFMAVSWTQFVILSIVACGLTAGSVASEYQSKTIEMAALTRLDGLRMVLGKFTAAIVFCLVMLIVTIPVASICIMFGGISPQEITVTYIVMGTYCFMACSIGVYLSTMIGNTVGAFIVFLVLGWQVLANVMRFSIVAAMMSRIPGNASVDWRMLLVPGWAANYGLSSCPILGISVPSALVAAIVEILAGILLILMSSVRVRNFPRKRDALLRWLMLAFCAIVTFVDTGSTLSLSSSTGGIVNTLLGGGQTGLVVLYPLFSAQLVYLIAPIIASGQFRRHLSIPMHKYLFSFRRMFRPDIGGAIPYIILLSTVVYIVSAVTLAITVHQNGMPVDFNWYMKLILVGFLVLLSSMLISTVTIFFCALMRSRVVAVIISQSVIIGAGVIYAIVVFFNQLTPFSRYIYPGATSTGSMNISFSEMAIPLILCAALSTICFVLTGPIQARCGGVVED